MPKVTIAELPGLSGERIVALFGKPQFLRAEAAAEIWQYRGEDCVLHLFLYRGRGALEVRHAEAHPRPGAGDAGENQAFTGATADQCLGQLAAARPTS